ncbi:MAG TPA: ABC transporter permease [Thermomicrobiales bacterium]|nr:ABC transporter permease [Thermomicrobiales bacterium]
MGNINLSYLFEHPRRVFDLSVEHLTLALTVLAVALVLALPLGAIATRFHRLTLPILAILGAIYTIPSLAFLAALIPTPLGLGRDNALVVFVAYAQIFLVRNIVAGLRGVDPAMLEAARGIGMTSWQVFRQVRWPLALPVIMAGVRTALVTTISITSIAATVAAGGLGELLFTGLTRPPRIGLPMIVAGTVAITTLAVFTDILLRLLERQTAAAKAIRAAR